MAAVPPNWVFKVTIGKKPPTDPYIDRVNVAGIEKKGEAGIKYINEDPDRTIMTITTTMSPVFNTDYFSVGNTYYIYESHPSYLMFNTLYEKGAEEQPLSTIELNREKGIMTHAGDRPKGGSRRRRRRPSRKYKKSKRVLRRKSRSTRRR